MTWKPAWCDDHGFTVVPIDYTFLAGQWTCWRCEENARLQAEREWCEGILGADRRDAGDGRILATLANMAGVRLRELGGNS